MRQKHTLIKKYMYLQSEYNSSRDLEVFEVPY